MVTSEEEIARRLQETDTARSARRQQAATTIGKLARRHTELADQLADLERELGEILTAAGDVIDLPELAEVTDVPVADLTRWRDQVATPARRKRNGSSAKRNSSGKGTQTASASRTVAPPTTPAPAEPSTTPAGAVLGATSS